MSVRDVILVVFVTSYLDVCEALVELTVKRRQLVDRAVEGAVKVTSHLTEEKRRERNLHNDALCRE